MTHGESDSSTRVSIKSAESIDPLDLAICLRVLDEGGALPIDHPDSVVLQHAVSKLFKAAKRSRRLSVRRQRQDHDRAVIEATATGSPQRIDDETAGILAETTVAGSIAGHLQRSQDCYICKKAFTQIDSFYHQLCPKCAAFNRSKRDPKVNLSGKRALLTGGRAKIGMYIALMLLRSGADLTITTRFPKDAARRFATMPDFGSWSDRLTVVGIDLRDPVQVANLADSVTAGGHLDILINNAAQTVRRTAGSYSALVAGEAASLSGSAARVPRLTMGSTSEVHPRSLLAPVGGTPTPDKIAELALQAGSAAPVRISAGTAIDAGGLLPDVVDTNSWVQTIDEVQPLEMLEVQLCNAVAPFILASRLRPAMRASAARRKYIVNVSAMEGQFNRRYKGPGHPHTNMAKAGLNMLTRTSAQEMLDSDGILMAAVDTGWITDERPHSTKMRLADEGFHAPLDLVDGAARVLDPIVMGEQGTDLYGCFLKDFYPSPW